ncbi:hypothetical protein BVIR_2619 [Blastochloris viridis]|uniref:SPOR domain-containing protein n=2 Tax=Blastochloris viridis TaxID=1079 RepID=A0A0P0JIX6_BLAVI|nr:hypothetical protein BVIR_2619 [Blastochloris viridis]CUU43046.1 hypothetical protein BVIRIDIS_20630 [Blastochloris viridis]
MRHAARLICLAGIASTMVLPAAAEREMKPPAVPLVVAVNDTPCGWYVIYMCSRERSEATHWYDQHEAIPGVVVKTGPDTPNFAPGWFCVADGPKDREDAIARAEEIRGWGSAPEAYAKNSCR